MTDDRKVQKRALVTGGSGGLGTAICRALSAVGAHVIVHANRRPERAQALAALTPQLTGEARASF